MLEDLEGLGDIPGRRAAAVALGNMMTEYQARFLATSLHMLNRWGQQKSPITRIQAPGVLVARDQNGTVIVPAPVDYLSWTPRIAGFATAPALLGLQHRVLWIPAKMTPLARQQLGLMAGRSTKAHNHSTPRFERRLPICREPVVEVECQTVDALSFERVLVRDEERGNDRERRARKINQEFNNEKHKTIVTGKRTRNVARITCWSGSAGKRSVRLRGHYSGSGCAATANADRTD